MNRRFPGFGTLMCGLLALCASAAAGERFEQIYIPNGMATADVGDWVLIKLPNNTTQKHSVVSRTGQGESAKLTLRIETIVNERTVSSQTQVQTAGEQFVKPPEPRGGERRFYERREEMVPFEDTEILTTIIDVYEGDTHLRTWYLSPEFPLYGTMKRVTANGTVEFEVVDYDFGAEADTE